MTTTAEKIHALKGTAACRTSARMQAAEIDLNHRKAAVDRAIAAEREMVARYGAGDASRHDVEQAELDTMEAKAKAALARNALNAARSDYTQTHLEALRPTAAQIDDILRSIASQLEAVRSHAHVIDQHGAQNGLPTHRIIASAARLGDVVRRLKDVA